MACFWAESRREKGKEVRGWGEKWMGCGRKRGERRERRKGETGEFMLVYVVLLRKIGQILAGFGQRELNKKRRRVKKRMVGELQKIARARGSSVFPRTPTRQTAACHCDIV